jgi:predicted small metal-binding protein
MSKHVACGMLVKGCAFEASAETEEELLQKVGAHGAAAHGFTEVTPELLAQVKAVIENR